MNDKERKLNPSRAVNSKNLQKILTTRDTKTVPELVARLTGQIEQVVNDPSVPILDCWGVAGTEERHRFLRIAAVQVLMRKWSL